MDAEEARELAIKHLNRNDIYPYQWGQRSQQDYNGDHDVTVRTPDGDRHLRVDDSGQVTEMR